MINLTLTTDKAPYFYAAYALIWVALVLYVGWIGMRVRSLEERLEARRKKAP
jgi:CcmD family protein